MVMTFKALSALLSYPGEDLKASAADIRRVLADEGLVPAWLFERLCRLIDEIETADLVDLQERYVFLFDRTRSLSLHLFEHVHGESRDRGQAMVDLRTLYEEAGLDADMRELPDFLPMFLEYLSMRPEDEARSLLAEPVAVIAALRERLSRRKSPYAFVLRTLEAIAAREPSAKELDELRKAPDFAADDLEALDAEWMEQPVNFGPGDACDSVRRPEMRS